MSTKSSWWSSWRSSIQPSRKTRRRSTGGGAAASPESRGATISRPFRVGTRPPRQQRPSLDCVFTLDPSRAINTLAEPAASPATLRVSPSHGDGEQQAAVAATPAASNTMTEAERQSLAMVQTSEPVRHAESDSASEPQRIMRKPSDLSSFTSKLVRQLLLEGIIWTDGLPNIPTPHTSPKVSTTTLSTFARFKDKELPLIPTRPASRCSSTSSGKSFEAGDNHSSFGSESDTTSLDHHSPKCIQRTSRGAQDAGYNWCGFKARLARRKSTPVAAAGKTIASLGQNWSHKATTLRACRNRPSISSPMTRIVFLAHDDVEDGWVMLGTVAKNVAELEEGALNPEDDP